MGCLFKSEIEEKVAVGGTKVQRILPSAVWSIVKRAVCGVMFRSCRSLQGKS